jgi:hypothetical protein
MKNLKFIILFVAMMLPSVIFAQSRLFSDLSNDDKIKSTYVSKAMLQLASGVLGNSVDIAAGTSLDVSKIINNVNSIEIVSTEKKGKVKKIQKVVDKLTKTYSLQPLMEVPNQNKKNDNKNTQILCETDDYTGLVSKILYIEKEKSRMQVIVVQGAINVADILNK